MRPYVEQPSVPKRIVWMESSEPLKQQTIPVAPPLPLPGGCYFIEIWPEKGEIIDGTLKDEQISHWLKNASKSPTLEGVRKPAFRILYGDGYLGVGRDDVRMPFTKERMDEIMTNFRLPGAFLPMMHEETTRYSGFTLFDDDGQVCGESLNVKYFSWWLGTASLALSRDRQSKTISGLFLGTRNQAAYGDMINRLRERQALITHPLLFPLIICEKMAKEHSHAINAATRQVFGLEQSVGVHDYGTDLGERLAIVTVVSSLDVDTVTRKLNGELSRLANYEKWVNSHTVMLDSFFDSIQEEIRELKPLENQVLVRVRDMCAFLRGWNVDMAARIACQQKIVSGLIQTIYNVLAQRDNKLNLQIATSSKQDSTAMRTIAVVTMVFIPGAYIATLFSMNMFDWHAKDGERVLSDNFWIYCAITLPVTAFVLLIWAIWSRPWKALS